MRNRSVTCVGRGVRVSAIALSAVMVLCGVGSVLAQGEEAPGSHRDWGISWLVRGGSASGGYGEFLENALAWDLDIYRQKGDWRFGAGLTFGSLDMKSPYGDEPEWAHFETYGLATRVFRNREALRPYLQGRLGVVRMHPRSELFLKKPVEELEPGESPTDAVNGVGVSLIPGLELSLTPGLSLDVSAYLNTYLTADYDMSPIGRSDAGDGFEMGGRVGATWRPTSFEAPPRPEGAPDTTALDPESRSKDAWGVTKSHGWAAGEVLAINFGASMFNEYVRQANFNQISPRSFWHNLEDGFYYDDNKFKTNQLVHPFNGSTYYNSSRANGLSFWPSTMYSLAGAFIWEAMGETHPMSYNDMISTGIGGIAFGETTYRLSSSLLDNTSDGSGRIWREIGGFLIDPVRGFNRFLSGQATKVQGNPASPYDHNPPNDFTALGVGARMIGRGESIQDSTQTRTVLDLYINHGSPWENERRKPFDHFDVGAQFNGDNKTPLGRFQIRGDLFSKAFGGSKGDKHALALVQTFDYINNFDYEFGAQSFGGALFSRFQPSQKLGINTRVDAMWNVLAAVNAEYSFLSEVEDRERFREYDYGPGAGVSAEASGSWSGNRILFLAYRGEWVNVQNGSVWNPSKTGSNANHFVQAATAKLNVPIRGPMGLGLDGTLFLRQSHYELVQIKDVRQRVPQVRLYLNWNIPG